MKILLFLFGFLLFLGCENTTSSSQTRYPFELLQKQYDCAGVAGGDNICGCTDSTATNFDSLATYDDGSCEVDPCPDLTTAANDATAAYIDALLADLTGDHSALCAAMVAAYKAGLDAGCDGYTQADYDELVALCSS